MINGAPPIASVGGYLLTWNKKLVHSDPVGSFHREALTWDHVSLVLTLTKRLLIVIRAAPLAKIAGRVAPHMRADGRTVPFSHLEIHSE